MKKFVIILLILLSCVFSSYAQDIKGDVISTTIEFVINTDNVIPNDNYFQFLDITVPFIRDNSEKISKVLLIGSASPEGNKNANIILANKRADKICTYLLKFIPRDKIIINNDYNLFLEKTKLTEKEYTKLRATYIEIYIENNIDYIQPQYDTVYIVNTIEKKDTVYIDKPIEVKKDEQIIFSIYNSITEDLLKRKNIGIEFYFNKMSFFLEGSFSGGYLFGKNYNIDYWNTGFRKYFNKNYDKVFAEIYGTGGYFDTDLFSTNGKYGIFYGGGLGIGYKFSFKYGWKLYSLIRFGIIGFKFNDYYYYGNGNINILFDKYIDGQNNENSIERENNAILNTNIYYNDRSINSQFFKNSYNGFWIGPTYIGLTIQKDFYIKIKK